MVKLPERVGKRCERLMAMIPFSYSFSGDWLRIGDSVKRCLMLQIQIRVPNCELKFLLDDVPAMKLKVRLWFDSGERAAVPRSVRTILLACEREVKMKSSRGKYIEA